MSIVIAVLLVAILGVVGAQLRQQVEQARRLNLDIQIGLVKLGALLQAQHTNIGVLIDILSEHQKPKLPPVVHIEHAHTAAPHGAHGPVK